MATGTKQAEKGKQLEQLRRVLHLIHVARYADEKMSRLAKQNKGGTFQLAATGHELLGVVCGQMLQGGRDWSLPYYRDQPFAIGLGCDLTELFGVFLGRATLNQSSGRMMPYHFSHRELRIVCQSSVVGSQFLQGAGRALGVKQLGRDELVYVSAGDGATSQGDFHEALNFSALHKLPVIFVIHDNGWAISVPAQEQTAGGDCATFVEHYPGQKLFRVDGTSYPQIEEAMRQAIARGRAGEGPSVIVARVPRMASHSNSDDPRKYKTADLVAQDQVRDPLQRYCEWLVAQGHMDWQEIDEVRAAAQLEVEKAADAAELIPFPEPATATRHVFVEEQMGAHAGRPQAQVAVEHPMKDTRPDTPGDKIVMMDALNRALQEEMERDPNVVVFGQDVAHGKGGVFGITAGLTQRFGPSRCFNTPLAESTIIGAAAGMASDGICRPVAEIQFADYMWTGVNQLINELASLHYRSGGEWWAPTVIRMPSGGYIQGGPYHSQSIESYLCHTPGLKVVMPSNAADAKALLKMAIRDPNPVVFLEHKLLYRQAKFAARPDPGPNTLLPFGQAQIVREGQHVTVVCWGYMVMMAWEVAEELSYEGISVEVIDPRTLAPFDMATLLRSVEKTGKLLILHEAPVRGGFGAELAARVADEAFNMLDAPIRRLGAAHCAVPYSKPLENAVLPQKEQLLTAIRDLANY
jgi:2-oxoisovalerate dehydrogenase E1 component